MRRSRDAERHALLLVACLAGVVGIGIIFQGSMHGNLAELSRGIPAFLLGTWWAGRELGRSMMLSRQRKQTVAASSLAQASQEGISGVEPMPR